MKVVTTNLLNRFWKNGIVPIKNALVGKFDASKVVASRNITEPGYVMEGKTASEALAELNRKSINLVELWSGDITANTTTALSADGTPYDAFLVAYHVGTVCGTALVPKGIKRALQVTGHGNGYVPTVYITQITINSANFITSDQAYQRTNETKPSNASGGFHIVGIYGVHII